MSDETIPLAYFLTFTCYGAWLHGEKEISVDREHNTYGTPYVEINRIRTEYVKRRMKHPPYILDAEKRKIVMKSIQKTCKYFGWDLYAAHVRSNHVHLVISVALDPETMLAKLKRYISRALNESMPEDKSIRRWTRHGSTRYLWRTENVVSTVLYVVDGQGDPMEVYLDSRYAIVPGDFA